MSTVIEDICELLESYSGRDKVVRLSCYAAKLYGCLHNDKSWQAAGSKLSNCRMMLRLFDDIPQAKYAYNYGLGRHEPTFSAAFLGVLANIINQAYYPVEKAIWFNEVGVLKLKSSTAEKLDLLSTVMWAGGLYISLLQNLRLIRHLLWSRDCLHFSEDFTEAKRNLDVRLLLQWITALKQCLDITHAVSCLPEGWLWGEKIGATKVAAIATTSSLVGIGLFFAKKRLLK